MGIPVQFRNFNDAFLDMVGIENHEPEEAMTAKDRTAPMTAAEWMQARRMK